MDKDKPTGAYKFRQTLFHKVLIQIEVELLEASGLEKRYVWRDATIIDLLDPAMNSLIMLRHRRHRVEGSQSVIQQLTDLQKAE